MSMKDLPARTTGPGLLTRVAEAADAGADDVAIQALERMLETGARPSLIAKEAGIDKDALWLMINTNKTLSAAMQRGTLLKQRQTSEAVRERIQGIVTAMADMVDDPEVPGPARVQAGKEFWNMAKDLGVIEPAGGGSGGQGVAVMDGEFQGRLMVVLGGRND